MPGNHILAEPAFNRRIALQQRRRRLGFTASLRMFVSSRKRPAAGGVTVRRRAPASPRGIVGSPLHQRRAAKCGQDAADTRRLVTVDAPHKVRPQRTGRRVIRSKQPSQTPDQRLIRIKPAHLEAAQPALGRSGGDARPARDVENYSPRRSSRERAIWPEKAMTEIAPHRRTLRPPRTRHTSLVCDPDRMKATTV